MFEYDIFVFEKQMNFGAPLTENFIAHNLGFHNACYPGNIEIEN